MLNNDFKAPSKKKWNIVSYLRLDYYYYYYYYHYYYYFVALFLLLLVKEVEKVELNRENQAVDELKQILIVLSLISPSKRPQNYKEG